jgi:hypothetical protein
MRHRVQMDKPRRTKTIVRREKDGCELLVFHGENARGFRPLPQVTDTANPTLRSRYRFTASPGKARAYLSNQSRSVSWTSIPLRLLDRRSARGRVFTRSAHRVGPWAVPSAISISNTYTLHHPGRQTISFCYLHAFVIDTRKPLISFINSRRGTEMMTSKCARKMYDSNMNQKAECHIPLI